MFLKYDNWSGSRRVLISRIQISSKSISFETHHLGCRGRWTGTAVLGRRRTVKDGRFSRSPSGEPCSDAQICILTVTLRAGHFCQRGQKPKLNQETYSDCENFLIICMKTRNNIFEIPCIRNEQKFKIFVAKIKFTKTIRSGEIKLFCSTDCTLWFSYIRCGLYGTIHTIMVSAND